jgi:hypothetical protein
MILTDRDRQFLKGARISMSEDFGEAAPDDAWFRALNAAGQWRQAKLTLAACGKRLVDSLQELTPAQQSRFNRKVFSAILAENPFKNGDR